MKYKAIISGIEAYAPDYVLTNAMLENMVETNDEWIQSRTGIKERRILKDPTKATSDIGVEAINKLLKKKGISPDEIDMVICATTTPDHIFPATANIISDKVGIKNAFGFDVSAACSGFLYALNVGSKFVESGTHKKVLVVGADKMSSIMNYEDRNTCIIFGDGGGVVLLEPTEDMDLGIHDSILKSDGQGRHYLHQKAGGSLHPATHETVENKEHFAYQEGKTVFKFAVKGMSDTTFELMQRNNLNAENLDWLVPHQANIRIIEATRKRAELPVEKVMVNIQKYGNTTNGTIPLCLWEWENKLKKGDKLILTAFGGGFTWGATYLTWAYNS
ncbi:MAG: beta-ketoacyl-ACP synthase III [Chitinophagales bacterium]